MKLALVTLALTLALVTVPGRSSPVKIGDLQFDDNFDSLMARAQQSQKYIVIDWFTDW